MKQVKCPICNELIGKYFIYVSHIKIAHPEFPIRIEPFKDASGKNRRHYCCSLCDWWSGSVIETTKHILREHTKRMAGPTKVLPPDTSPPTLSFENFITGMSKTISEVASLRTKNHELEELLAIQDSELSKLKEECKVWKEKATLWSKTLIDVQNSLAISNDR